MPSTRKTYTLGKMKQLIDLNEDVTNFNLDFSVTSKTGEEFDAVVVTQTRLDNDENIQYERAPGTISGNIESNKGEYQNYFLLLKAETPREVDVEINFNETPKRVEHYQSPIQQPSTIPSLIPPKKQSSINWKTVLIFVVVVGGAALLYYYYTKNKKEMSSKILISTPSPVKSIVPSPVKSIAASIHTTPVSIPPAPPRANFEGNQANQSLWARLNSLPMRS